MVMTLGGPEIRDHAQGNRPLYIVLPPVIVPVALAFAGAGAGTVIGSIFAAAAAGAWVRGVKRTRQPNQFDRSWLVQEWVRPASLTYITAGVVIASAALALALMLGDLVGGHFPSLWAWFVSIVVWGGAVTGAVLLIIRTRDAQVEEVQTEAAKTYELALLDRVENQMFIKAGLTVASRNAQGGNDWCPSVIETGLDDLGNPFYLARAIEGHQPLSVWEKAADRLASAWHVEEVKVSQEAVNVIRVTVPLHRFQRSEPVRWEPSVENIERLPPVAKYLASLKFGEFGDRPEPVFLSVVEANYTVGGVPGSGKSSFVDSLIAHCALHPHIDIAFIDPKRVGAPAWRPRLSAVAVEHKESAALIKWLLEDAQSTYDDMAERGHRNAWKEGLLGADHHVKVLVIDEAAELFISGDRETNKRTEQMIEDLRRVVSLGRAAGYVVVLATQIPTGDSLPTAVRNLTSDRIAFKSKSDTAARAILGSEWNAGLGEEANPLRIKYDPANPQPGDERGQGVVDGASLSFARVQFSYITAEECSEVARRTRNYRVQWPWNDDLAKRRRDRTRDEEPEADRPEPPRPTLDDIIGDRDDQAEGGDN